MTLFHIIRALFTDSSNPFESSCMATLKFHVEIPPFIIVGTKSDLRGEKVISKAECCGGFVLYKHGKKNLKNLMQRDV